MSLSKTPMADTCLRKVSFTGLTRVGRVPLSKCMPHILNSSLELGGDGPFIALDDNDIDLAVNQEIVCKFRYAGQACAASNRVIADRKAEVEFTDKFVAEISKLTVGMIWRRSMLARQRDPLPGTLGDLTSAGVRILPASVSSKCPGISSIP